MKSKQSKTIKQAFDEFLLEADEQFKNGVEVVVLIREKDGSTMLSLDNVGVEKGLEMFSLGVQRYFSRKMTENKEDKPKIIKKSK